MHPTKDRNHSGIHISHGSENILLDCGEGIQRQMRIAKLKLAKLSHIFISHWHGDHAIGLAGLLTSIGADQCSHTIHVYGPKGSKEKFRLLKKVFPSMNAVKHKVHEINSEGIILDNKDFVIESYKLKHNMPCIGFALKEKDRLKIDMKKAKKAGLSEGPILAKIKDGKNVRVKGKLVKSKDITYKILGKKISYVADTRPCPGARNLAKKSNLLIIECTYHSSDKAHALQYYHLTAKECGQIATKGEVKQLFLTHPSPRYKEVSSLVKEAKKEFKKVKFAEDFMEVEL
jgi:ribonuclease Z